MKSNPFTRSVTLDGADKVKSSLSDLAKFGKDAFDQIGKAGKDAFDNIGKSVGEVGKASGEVSKKLSEIGTTGRGAFDQIRQAAANAGSTELTSGLSSVSTMLSEVSDKANAAGSSLSRSLASVGNFGRGLVPTIGTVGIIVGSVLALKSALTAVGAASADTAAKIMDTAKSAGMTTEAYQRFVLAGEKAGLSSEQIAAGLAAIKRATDDAAAGSTVLGANFRKLGDATSGVTTFYAGAGVSITKFGGAISGAGAKAEHFKTVFGGVQRNVESTADYIKTLSAALDAMPDGAQKTKVLEDLSKKFGDEFVQSLSLIASGVEETSDLFDKLGLKLSETDEAAVTAQQTSLVRMKAGLDNQGQIISKAVGGIRLQLGLIFTPLATSSQDSISNFIDAHKTAIEDFIGGYVTPAIRATKEFVASLGEEGGALDQARTAFAALWEDIKDNALNAFLFIQDIAGNTFASIGELLSGKDVVSWEGVKKSASSAAEWISGKWKAAAVSISAGWNDIKLGADFQLDIAQIAIGSETTFQKVQAYASAAFDYITFQIAQVVPQWAGKLVLLNQFIRDLLNGVPEAAANALSGISDVVSAGYESIKTAALEAFPDLADMWNSFEAMGRDAFAALGQVSGATWLEIGIGAVATAVLFGGGFTAIGLAGAAMWRGLLEGAIEISPGLSAEWAALRIAASASFEWVSLVARTAWDYILTLFNSDKALQASAWDLLKASASAAWESILITFGAGWTAVRSSILSAAPWLRGPWKAIEDAVKSAWTAIKNEHSAGFPAIKGIWDNLVAIWKGVETAAGLVAKAINLIFGTSLTGKDVIILAVFAQMLGIMPAVIGGLTLVAVTIGIVSAAFGAATSIVKFGLLLASLGPEGLLIIAVIGAIGVALYELYIHWDDIKAAASAAWEAMKNGASSAWQWIKTTAGDFFAWVGGKFDALKSLAGGAWDGMKSAAQSAMDFMSSGLGKIESAAARAWAALKGSVSAVGSVVSGAASGAASAVMGGIQPAAMVPAFSGSGAGGASRSAGLIAFPLGIGGSQFDVYGSDEVVADLRRLAADIQSSKTLKNNPSWDK
jgi:phage-related protein